MKKLKTQILLHLFSALLLSLPLYSQDTLRQRLRLNIPLIDYPQNFALPYKAPSMIQAFELSRDCYELSFSGIDKLGDKIFIPKSKPYTRWRRFSNNLFKYGLSFGFSKYGSELPVPLGVWAHEEFHRSVLGINSISSKNGNWIFHRWDGTVYGITDSSLSQLKRAKPDQLLYSYVAGVQYEIMLNEKITIDDFYSPRTMSKNALLLYNAFYVYNYFKFSTSNISDSVKVLAPKYEDKDAAGRDYAGADLTAWVYDMFNPLTAYQTRDSFPGGDGVNRRIGFSDLSSEAQEFLKEQKKFSMLNFLNPAIFFIDRIKVNNDFTFNLFAQYAPTHFGNDMAVYIPVTVNRYKLLFNAHNYNGKNHKGYGVGIGVYDLRLIKNVETDFSINIWDQPDSFFSTKGRVGGSSTFTINYLVRKNLSLYCSASTKTQGWMMGNPYLENNFSSQLGVKYRAIN